MRRPLPRELWFGVLAFGVLAAGDHARTPGEDITPHDVKTEAEPGEGPLADPAAPAFAGGQQTDGSPAASVGVRTEEKSDLREQIASWKTLPGRNAHTDF